MSRQVPEQLVCPGGHVTTHTLDWHVRPAAQTVPQVPQLAGSMRVSTQAAVIPEPQRESGEAQSSTHALATHTLPVGQRVPQPPQWSRSVLVDTHALPHTAWPAGHDSRHVPAPHT